MKINDVTFEFNSTTLEGIEAMENAFKATEGIRKSADAAIDAGNLVAGAKLSIQANREFFKTLVGVDVVGDCNSPILAGIFLESFNKQCEEQKRKLREEYFKRDLK